MLNPYSTLSTWWNYVTGDLSKQTALTASWADQYRVLDAYYYQNGLYEIVNHLLKSRTGDKALKPLRNPAYRVTEFYAAKVWSGSNYDSLPIETDNEALIDAVHTVWNWSNWSTLKQKAVRTMVKKGDLFLQVATNAAGGFGGDKVYFQVIQPEHVTDFDCDERGHLSWIRLDIPQSSRLPDGKEEYYTYTAIWDRDSLRTWKNRDGLGVNIGSLGEADTETPLADMGIDFIPFVYQPLKGDHDKRAVGAYTLSLDKIDEVNRQVTRLHEMLFRYNKPMFITTRTGVNAAGQPLPPINLGVNAPVERGEQDDGSIKDDVFNLPSQADLNSLIPDINYTEALAVIDAQMSELKDDMPELAYYDIRSTSQLSGTAIRLMLGDTIDRAKEARAAAESALIRANQMALTVGQTIGLFQNVGTFENGDFAHSFREREIINSTALDHATTFQMWTSGGAPANYALRRTGATDEQIAQYAADAQAETSAQNNGLAAALLNARTNFDRGDGET